MSQTWFSWSICTLLICYFIYVPTFLPTYLFLPYLCKNRNLKDCVPVWYWSRLTFCNRSIVRRLVCKSLTWNFCFPSFLLSRNVTWRDIQTWTSFYYTITISREYQKGTLPFDLFLANCKYYFDFVELPVTYSNYNIYGKYSLRLRSRICCLLSTPCTREWLSEVRCVRDLNCWRCEVVTASSTNTFSTYLPGYWWVLSFGYKATKRFPTLL